MTCMSESLQGELQPAQHHEDQERRTQLWEGLKAPTPALVWPSVCLDRRWNYSHFIWFKVVLKVKGSFEINQASALTLGREEKPTLERSQTFCPFLKNRSNLSDNKNAKDWAWLPNVRISLYSLTAVVPWQGFYVVDYVTPRLTGPFFFFFSGVCAVIEAWTRFYNCSF